MQNAKREYEILEEHGLPVVVMEPVRGGALHTLCPEGIEMLKKADPNATPASWALRFAASLPNVLVVLSGMTTMEHMKDNVATVDAVSYTHLDVYKRQRHHRSGRFEEPGRFYFAGLCGYGNERRHSSGASFL